MISAGNTLVADALVGPRQDLLVIEAKIDASEATEGDVLAKAAHSPSPFDSQLYLFESVGTLAHILNAEPEQQVALLNVSMFVHGFQVLERGCRLSSCRLLKASRQAPEQR